MKKNGYWDIFKGKYSSGSFPRSFKIVEVSEYINMTFPTITTTEKSMLFTLK